MRDVGSFSGAYEVPQSLQRSEKPAVIAGDLRMDLRAVPPAAAIVKAEHWSIRHHPNVETYMSAE